MPDERYGSHALTSLMEMTAQIRRSVMRAPHSRVVGLLAHGYSEQKREHMSVVAIGLLRRQDKQRSASRIGINRLYTVLAGHYLWPVLNGRRLSDPR